MSFPIAVQSAIFYVLACTPCVKIRQEHRIRADAKRERAEKERIIREQPDLYRHPSPYNTNPYWQEEILNGPSPPPKYCAKAASRGRLGSSGKDSIVSGLPAVSLDSRSTIVASPTSQEGEAGALSLTGNADPAGSPQKDKELCGQRPVQKLVNAISKASLSAGRFVENKLGIQPVTEEDRHDFYFGHHKNPPVNDLHPPVVSAKVPHPGAHRWMLEPPPPAKVMEGRVPARRKSSAASKASVGTPTTDDPPPFDRYLVEKHLEESARLARGPTEEELINKLIGYPMPFGALSRRSRSFSIESSSSGSHSDGEWSGRKRRSSHTSYGWASPLSSYDGSPVEEKRSLTPSRSRESLTGKSPDAPMHAAQRPKLQTIMSSRIGTLGHESSEMTTTSEGTSTTATSGTTASAP